MISPARRVSYRLLNQIEERRLFSDDALNSESMRKLERRDRNLTTEIVYGCLRWRASLDYVLAAASSRPWSEVDPKARILLRASLYQMWKMDRIPDHALVNDAVELAKRELRSGIEKYVNGILRRIARTRLWEKSDLIRKAPSWVQVSLQQWLWERWVSRYGESLASEYALSLNTPPPVALRCSGTAPDPARMTPSDLVPGAFIQDRCPSDPEESDLLFPPRQDEASQLIPHLLGPSEGWKIWDCCAAPGGKSAILSAKCGVSGRLVASDRSGRRVRSLEEVLQTSAIRNYDVLVADAALSPPFSCGFDAVLVDAPCSGLGTLRRNPEIKWNFQPSELARLQQTQKVILASASEAVREGGYLLYSTCSTEPEENEDVVQAFLNRHRDFRLIPPSFPKGIAAWTGEDKMVRTYPGPRLWDGFFAALMIRKRS